MLFLHAVDGVCVGLRKKENSNNIEYLDGTQFTQINELSVNLNNRNMDCLRLASWDGDDFDIWEFHCSHSWRCKVICEYSCPGK